MALGPAAQMQVSPSAPAAPAPTLPELRQELRLESGASGPGGTSMWLIVDPAQHRYVQIDETAYHILSRWRTGASFADLSQAVMHDFGDEITNEEIAQFVRFVSDNNLTTEPSNGGWRHFADTADRGRHGVLMWMVHNYLYVRLPLFRPESTLKRALPYVASLYTPTFFMFVLGFGLIGLYLVSRQWDVFYSTFQHFFSWEGAVAYAVAICLIKSAHELGHAFTAARFGCRVPSMGICFLVMFPVLYTDVTDAWRLRDRRERLMIGGAGVAVELMIACFATFAWSFLPEGVFKSLAFSLATVGWVLSLAINLNPLMRFDGYYLFADALGIDNLQSRAFAFGQWRMREFLFGLGKPAPESLPAKTALVLTTYAWLIWVYRLVVFTGIAVMVYHIAFKVLGIVLFLIEIIYFVLRPIAGELVRWWKDGVSIRATRRSHITAAATALAVIAAIVPWSTKISIPAVVEAAELARVYPQRSGVVARVVVMSGDQVQAGQVLVELRSDETDHQIALIKGKIALLQMRLARRSSDSEDRAQSLVMEQELRSVKSELEGLWKEQANLKIITPFSGSVAELNPSVHQGRTIGRAEFVALIRGNSALVARGYISQDDVSRLRPEAPGKFVPDIPGWPSFGVELLDLSRSGAGQIEMPELASQHGGAIAVRPHSGDGGRRRLVPVKAHYLATMAVVSGAAAPGFSSRGVVVLDGQAESFAGRAWRQVAAVLVRESGF
jgi:putative peptide zinc metalloprotease protein